LRRSDPADLPDFPAPSLRSAQLKVEAGADIDEAAIAAALLRHGARNEQERSVAPS
jgi:hypothetical protein